MIISFDLLREHSETPQRERKKIKGKRVGVVDLLKVFLCFTPMVCAYNKEEKLTLKGDILEQVSKFPIGLLERPCTCIT